MSGLSMATEDALAYCTDQVRRLDRARYQTTLFAPTALRGVVTALFAFDIEIAKIRDLVSEPLLGRIRVQWWRDSVGALFDCQKVLRIGCYITSN